MSILLHAQGLTRSFGPRPLFANLELAVVEGDRIGLIGPNGSGKSTLLRILAGRDQPDAGTLTMRKGLRVGYVPQVDVFAPGATPLSTVAHALRLEGAAASAPDDDHDLHERETAAAMVLDRIGFKAYDQPVEELSGGWRKRLAIAREVARNVDLLLLDEPTNHLDLEGIDWLQDWLDQETFGLIVVTHDRYFLEQTTTRIVEVNTAYPLGTFEVEGPYSEFLARRDEFLQGQATQQASLANKVRKDADWLSRRAAGRRTKGKGQIKDTQRRLHELAELQRRNTVQQAAGIEFASTGRQTRNLLRAFGISKSLGGRTLFANLDLTLSPGMRVGLLGPNGSGKTTLIKVLTGELQPDAGHIKAADNLRTAVFTQRRSELDRSQQLKEALCPVGDTIFLGDRSIHISSWARQFLFRPEQMNSPVGDLSGGEQARIIIANLVRQPADLLILDEPTNDLDIPSLEVLERSLDEFPGAVLLVTHDRFMLDRLATHILALDGLGNAEHHVSYQQYVTVKERTASEAAKQKEPAKPAATPAAAPAAQTSATATTSPAASGAKPRKGRLSFNEQREFDSMETRIHEAEQRVQDLEAGMNSPKLLADHRELAAHCKKLEAAQAEVAALYERWMELEAKLA